MWCDGSCRGGDDERPTEEGTDESAWHFGRLGWQRVLKDA